MALKQIVGKALGIGDNTAEVNDFLKSVNAMSGDEKEMKGRRRSTGGATQSFGGRDLIQIGNRLVQKLRAAGDDDALRRVSNAVFRLGKQRRR